MIQLIATDMDGTLLGSEAKITDDNARAIRDAQAEGFKVVVATGREYASASELLAEKKLENIQMICLNGAQTRSEKGELIEEIVLPSKEILAVYNAIKNEKVIFQVYTSDDVFGEKREETISLLTEYFLSINEEMTKDGAEKLSTKFTDAHIPHFIDDFQEFLNTYTENSFLKIIVSGYHADMIGYLSPKLAHIENIAISASGGNNIEITHINAQKGIALTNLADNLGIDITNVMALGDNLNDISMLSIVGHSVAMGNGVQEVKNTALYTTKPNYESGVAHAIDKYVLNKK